jgi:hypothetical protein
MEPVRNDEGRGALRVGVVCGTVALTTVVLAAVDPSRAVMVAWLIACGFVLVFGVLVTVRVLTRTGRTTWRPITGVVLVACSILLVAGAAMAQLL